MSNSSLLIVLDYLPNLMDCVAAVGEEKTIFPLPFWVLGWDPYNKRQKN